MLNHVEAAIASFSTPESACHKEIVVEAANNLISVGTTADGMYRVNAPSILIDLEDADDADDVCEALLAYARGAAELKMRAGGYRQIKNAPKGCGSRIAKRGEYKGWTEFCFGPDGFLGVEGKAHAASIKLALVAFNESVNTGERVSCDAVELEAVFADTI